MRKNLLYIFCAAFFAAALLIPVIRADELDDISKQLETLNTELKNKEANHQSLESELNNIKSQVVFLESEIVEKEKEVRLGEKTLGKQKTLLNARAKSYYKNITKNAYSIVNLLVSQNFSISLKNFFYQKTVVDEDRNTIVKLVLYIKNIEEKKASLESEKSRLAKVKGEVDRQSKLLAGEIAGTKSKIATLTEKQQQLVAAKLASLNIPRSAATSLKGCSDDRAVDPGFSPRFAAFTYGVPNRIGLNQYGAKGRAESGQNYEEILRAYYNFDSLQDADTNIKIRVDGHGEHALEDYVKRIYEMPADWSMEALKAQAVAARSYVLAYTNNGSGSICDSQNCQVFQDNEKGGRWNEAVDATRGKIMAQGGGPIKAWYSSTHGGIILSSGEVPGWSGTSWTKHGVDTPSGSAGSLEDLQNNAFDRSSPWFYCDWGARGEYSNTAWLKSSELADIVNVILLTQKDGSTGTHLSQTDKGIPDTWDAEKVKAELKSRGGSPHNSITSASISADAAGGKTNSISFSGDGGSSSFSGSDFKTWFNVRAPANIQIVGPLYSIEKR